MGKEGKRKAREEKRAAKKAKKAALTVQKQNLAGGKLTPALVASLLAFVFSEEEQPPNPPRWVSVSRRARVDRAVLVLVEDGGEYEEKEWRPVRSRAAHRGLIPLRLPDDRCSVSHLFARLPQAAGAHPLAPPPPWAAAGGAPQPPPPEHYCLDAAAMAENGYTTGEGVPTRPAQADGPGGRVLAADCEMVRSAGGRAMLARVTVVDEGGAAVVDTLVRPDEPVADYLTRYSGVTAEMLEGPGAVPFEAARESFLRAVRACDVLVGHSLENDLAALRVTHARVVDTAVLFPHPRGPPRKQSLRHLAARHLGRDIQQGGAAGHCPLEDARAALDLARLVFEHGPRVWARPRGEPLARAVGPGVRTAAVGSRAEAVAPFAAADAAEQHVAESDEAAAGAAAERLCSEDAAAAGGGGGGGRLVVCCLRGGRQGDGGDGAVVEGLLERVPRGTLFVVAVRRRGVLLGVA